METQNFQPFNDRSQNSSTNWKLMIKCAIIAGIYMILMIPLFLIGNLISERMERHHSAITEVGDKWGQAQTIVAPFIQVPVMEVAADSEGMKREIKKNIFIMATETRIESMINPIKKRRGIYQVNLYESDVKIATHFKNIDFEKYKIDPESILWDEAHLISGVSDVIGLRNEVICTIDGRELQVPVFESQMKVISNSMGIPVDNTILNKDIEVALKINGNSSFRIASNANKNTINMASSYPHPSFIGLFLPYGTEMTRDGFSARWQSIASQRTFPQVFDNINIDILKNAVGVQMIDVNSHYTKTDKIYKYAFLFIGLTFGVFFLIEIRMKLNMYPLQYVLIGLALVVFYTLLLSCSEVIGFNTSYFIASLSTVLMIALYVKGVFKHSKIFLGFLSGLSVLYAYVYFLIQLEDMAFLFGSVALFVLLGMLMYFTRNLDIEKKPAGES